MSESTYIGWAFGVWGLRVWEHGLTIFNSRQLEEENVTSFLSLNQFFSSHLQSLLGGQVFLEAPSQILAFVFLETFSLWGQKTQAIFQLLLIGLLCWRQTAALKWIRFWLEEMNDYDYIINSKQFVQFVISKFTKFLNTIQ